MNDLEKINNQKKYKIFDEILSQFSLEFGGYLNEKIAEIIEKNGLIFEDNVLKKGISKFKAELFNFLDVKINQKILCKITFENGYSLYKLFEGLEKINSQAFFKINYDNIEIYAINDSKTYLMRVLLKVENKKFSFFKKSDLSINLTDLIKILKCNKSVDIISTLIFKENQLNVNMFSKKYKLKISRNLKNIELNFEKDNIIDNLMKLSYLGEFILDKNKLNYFFSQSGRYSEVIKLKLTNNFVCFSEYDKRGNSEIRWDKNILPSLKISPKNLEKELIGLNNKNSFEFKEEKEKLNQELIEFLKNGIIAYFSLKNLKKITPFLFEKNSSIKFYIQQEIPIKIRINFKSLEDSYGLFFLAQREIKAYE